MTASTRRAALGAILAARSQVGLSWPYLQPQLRLDPTSPKPAFGP